MIWVCALFCLEVMIIYVFQNEFEFITDQMNCLKSNFTKGLCQLNIEEVEFLKHQGNWTCEVRLNFPAQNTSWIKAPGNPVEIVVLVPDWKDMIVSHLNNIFAGFISYLDAVGNNSFKMPFC